MTTIFDKPRTGGSSGSATDVVDRSVIIIIEYGNDFRSFRYLEDNICITRPQPGGFVTNLRSGKIIVSV